MVASTAPDSTVSPFATSTLATVPSCGATTGVSIFMISSTTTGSPFFTAAPGAATTSTTLPAAPAVMEMLPAAPAAAGFAAGAGAGAAALGAGAAAGAPFVFSSTVTSYTFPFTVIV